MTEGPAALLRRTPEGAAHAPANGTGSSALPSGFAANQAMSDAPRNLSHQVKGRRGRGINEARAHMMLLPRVGDTLWDHAAHRLAEAFTADDATASS